MSFEGIFTFELLLVVLVVAVTLGGFLYLATRDRRIRRETDREVGTADVPVGTAPEESIENTAERVAPHEPREFYKSIGLEASVSKYENSFRTRLHCNRH
jgi:hypothetical protein